MKKFLIILLLITSCAVPKPCCGQTIDTKELLKFSTFYAAVNGGTSLSDVKVFSIDNGLSTQTISTPYDYNFTIGLRKIARFGYENKAQTFYDGTESNYSDAATVGKVRGVEYLFEVDYKRQEGIEYFDQTHFLRYVKDNWLAKAEYIKDGFADIEYFEASQRFRLKLGKKFSLHAGVAQRISEPYGYDPLEEWKLETGDIHYTYLAIEEGYSHNLTTGEYLDPDGTVVATNTEVWEAVTIPNILSEYTARKRNELSRQWNYSVVAGFDFYHFTDDFWFHSWGNVLPYHHDTGGEYL